MKYSPMWEVDNNIYFHYSDKVKAGETAVLKWVVMSKDYFIGTWQVKSNFAIKVFDTEEDAEDYVDKHKNK